MRQYNNKATKQFFSQVMKVKKIAKKNLNEVARMSLALWTDSSFEGEYEEAEDTLQSKKKTCFLLKDKKKYIGFISLSLRKEYVDGMTSSPLTYIEGIYVDPAYRRQGLGEKLIALGAEWGKKKGCLQYASDTDWYNEASINMHKKSGFQEVSKVICFVKDL